MLFSLTPKFQETVAFKMRFIEKCKLVASIKQPEGQTKYCNSTSSTLAHLTFQRTVQWSSMFITQSRLNKFQSLEWLKNIYLPNRVFVKRLYKSRLLFECNYFILIKSPFLFTRKYYASVHYSTVDNKETKFTRNGLRYQYIYDKQYLVQIYLVPPFIKISLPCTDT